MYHTLMLSAVKSVSHLLGTGDATRLLYTTRTHQCFGLILHQVFIILLILIIDGIYTIKMVLK